MIIYKDILTGDEIISDVYDVKDTEDGLMEVNCKNIMVGNENITLEGANPSAEGEDADEGGDSSAEQKLDIVHSFRLNSIPRPDKKVAQVEYKKYAKAVLTKLKESGKADQAKAFETTAPVAMKRIFGNWKQWDVYTGESMHEPCMWVLVDYREDGITPYAVMWKHALHEEKV